MQTRLIESWLTKVNERSFEVPFCQLLTFEGYQVLHLSRHGPAEQGKDILAIDPNGIPCAFQLKGSFGGKVTQKTWEGLLPQIQRLVELPIKHPSLKDVAEYRVFFVTTGELEEEVRQEIVDRNVVWSKKGFPTLETIVKGQLLQRFMVMKDDFWPQDLAAEKSLLEFFLADGTGYISKEDLFLLHLNLLAKDWSSNQELRRSLASAAIINSYALTAFEQKQNSVALIEGWATFLFTLLSTVTEKDVAPKYWSDIQEHCIYAIETAAENLLNELKTREYLTEGDPFVDAPFYKGRVTQVAAYVVWYALSQSDEATKQWALEFIKRNEADFELWGEAATPQFLAIYWFLKNTDRLWTDERILVNIFTSICTLNRDGNGLADPYHSLQEIKSKDFDLSTLFLGQEENFKGRSYSLEGIITLLARRRLRSVLSEYWKPVTFLHFANFKPKKIADFLRWHTEDGLFIIRLPEETQSWARLVQEASNIDNSAIPRILLETPLLLLLLSLVYPHRMTTDVIKALDTHFVNNDSAP